MPHRPTIKDVARRANVSISTVSLVINNKGYVSDGTKEKIQNAIHELGYYPSRSARGLASQRTGNIGFILTNDHFTQVEPFYTKIFLGAEFEAQKCNYYILLTTIGKIFNPQKYTPRFLLERNVDGVIVAGRVSKKLIEYINEIDLPLVLVDYELKKHWYSTVQINNYDGAHKAVEHLLSLGHRRIGFIGGEMNHPSILQRFKGYYDTLALIDIEPRQSWIVYDQSEAGIENGYKAAKKLFSNSSKTPTAVFTANDAMAIGALKYFNENNIRVPDDVAIVGFDNIEASYQANPPLTTVDVNKVEMGVEGVRTLVEMINDGNGIVRNIHTPVKLVVRESTSFKK